MEEKKSISFGGINVDKMFAYKHLPEGKQIISKMFYDCAKSFDEATPSNAEKTLTLRKLWEAKNLAVLANSDWK